MEAWIERIQKEVFSYASVSATSEAAYDPGFIWGFKVVKTKEGPQGIQFLIPGEIPQELTEKLLNLAEVYDLEFVIQPFGNFIVVWFWRARNEKREED